MNKMNIKYSVAMLFGLCAVAGLGIAILFLNRDQPDCKTLHFEFLKAEQVHAQHTEQLRKKYLAACEKVMSH